MIFTLLFGQGNPLLLTLDDSLTFAFSLILIQFNDEVSHQFVNTDLKLSVFLHFLYTHFISQSL